MENCKYQQGFCNQSIFILCENAGFSMRNWIHLLYWYFLWRFYKHVCLAEFFFLDFLAKEGVGNDRALGRNSYRIIESSANHLILSRCFWLTLTVILFLAAVVVTSILIVPFLMRLILASAACLHEGSVWISVIVKESVRKATPTSGPSIYTVREVSDCPKSSTQ